VDVAVGKALNRALAGDAQVDAELDAFIERRHKERVRLRVSVRRRKSGGRAPVSMPRPNASRHATSGTYTTKVRQSASGVPSRT